MVTRRAAETPVKEGSTLRQRKKHLSSSADAAPTRGGWKCRPQRILLNGSGGLGIWDDRKRRSAGAGGANASFHSNHGPVSPPTTAKAPHGHEHDAVWHPPHHSFNEQERLLMNHYESLDYDVVNSEIVQESRKNRTYWTVKCDWISRWFIFGLIGSITGVLAAAVAFTVEAIQEFKYGTAMDIIREGHNWQAFGFFIGVSCGFATIAVLLVVFLEPVAAGSGIAS